MTSGTPGRILVVDDEERIRSAIKEYFGWRGYRVDAAQEREEAEALLLSVCYSAVIADLRLTSAHGLDGLEILRFVRERRPSTRFVLLTAYGTPEIEEEARRLCVDAFLYKPKPLDELARVVCALLGEREPAPEAWHPACKRRQAPEGEGPAMEPRTILLVDDSKTALFMEATILRKGRYKLLTAADGQEAIDVALAERPDLILMDIVMPGLSGFEACRELRRREATKAIPIILVTTRGEEANVQAGFESGCTDYVTKPIDGLELLAKVRDCLGEQESPS